MSNEEKPLPDSLPLHSKNVGSFHKLRITDVSALFQQCENELKESLDQFMECVDNMEELDPLVKKLSGNFEVLNQEQKNFKVLNNSLNNAMREYKTKSEECEDIDLDNWDRYRKKELTAPSLSEIFCKNNSNDSTVQPSGRERVTETHRILSVLPYIWDDPTSVIPDDNDEEDDLKIDGGNIELTCPITCKPYEVPMISKKCQHVFDKAGIESYFDQESERGCPQAGCGKTLRVRDFEPDPVMVLRCKIANLRAHNHRREDDLNLDVL